jgi:hypothetical protein
MAKTVGQAGRLSYKRARTGLRVFLVHQAGKNNFGFPRARFHVCQLAECGEHRGNGTFGVAGAAPVQPAVFPVWNKLRLISADGVEVRR